MAFVYNMESVTKQQDEKYASRSAQGISSL